MKKIYFLSNLKLSLGLEKPIEVFQIISEDKYSYEITNNIETMQISKELFNSKYGNFFTKSGLKEKLNQEKKELRISFEKQEKNINYLLSKLNEIYSLQ